jgi:hypothetical protein
MVFVQRKKCIYFEEGVSLSGAEKESANINVKGE